MFLLLKADPGDYFVYQLGAWPAPFGISLVLDRLSALMVLLTAVVGLFSLIHSVRGTDLYGRNFHALFQLQIMGLNGAFLTGDLFNLFVFFEILLIASYTLLLHGRGQERLHAGLHYVVFNLAASALFLVAVGILYGLTGTLNMADLAVRVAGTGAEDAALIRAAGLLLLVVFAAKAALLPLYFWLPEAYAAATAPVAALFALMTKVGVYAIIRVFTLIFGPEGGHAANLADAWLLPTALATLALATLGVLASRNLRRLVSYLLLTSIGTMLIGVGLFNGAGLHAALYYLAHSTLVLAAFFLIAGEIGAQRGPAYDSLELGHRLAQPRLLGVLFLIAGVTAVGLPPMSGFIGKLLLLEASSGSAVRTWIWATILVTSLLTVIALARAGSVLLWRTRPWTREWHPLPANLRSLSPIVALLAFSLALVVGAQPVSRFAADAAHQLLSPSGYVEAVLGAPGFNAEATPIVRNPG